jgi:tRNA(Ile)-lysidine synthase
VPGHPDLTLLRPLLGATRADILAYCQTHAIVPREDATNTSTEPTRNWVRHELLPLIQKRYPGAPRALADLARSAAWDVEALDAMTQSLMVQAKAGDGWILMSRPLFRHALDAVQRRTVRCAVAALAPDAELSFERTEAVVDLFLNGRKGQKVELAGGMLATVDQETVMLTRTAS